MRIAFVGPPGAGKSTQAKRLARALPFWNTSPRLSSGEMVRAQIEAGTDLGRELEGYYERGEPVPDEKIVPLVLSRLTRSGGWVLDNFPANVAQARALDEALSARGSGGIGRVICLEGPSDEELLGRVTGGRVRSRATGEVYHLVNDPPPRPRDRRDPGPFERRGDDSEEALRRNLAAYRAESAELKRYYAERELLSVVDARGSIEEVAARVLDVLGHPEDQRFYETAGGRRSS